MRILVGFSKLKGVCVGTEFEEVAEVYRGVWGVVRSFVIDMARKWVMGFLVDFYAVYGGCEWGCAF